LRKFGQPRISPRRKNFDELRYEKESDFLEIDKFEENKR